MITLAPSCSAIFNIPSSEVLFSKAADTPPPYELPDMPSRSQATAALSKLRCRLFSFPLPLSICRIRKSFYKTHSMTSAITAVLSGYRRAHSETYSTTDFFTVLPPQVCVVFSPELKILPITVNTAADMTAI